MEGLAAAHGAGIIHRDLKPDNVFLLRNRGGQADFVKLLDFGISKFNQLSGDSGFSMTRTGAVMGTPYYMAPEQAKGSREMDHRVDLYAAGVILYEALTGQVPFNADTFNELLFKIVLEEPQPLEKMNPNVDPGFAAIVTKAMARDPAHRFQSARDFQAALAQWAAGHGAELATALRVTKTAQTPLTASALSRTPSPGAPVGPGTVGMSALGTGTPGTWAQTGAHDAGLDTIPKKSNTGLFIGVAAAGLLLGGGVIAMMKMRGDAEEAKKLADTHAAEKTAQEEAARVQAAKAEEERARAAAAEKEASAVRAEAEKAKAEAASAKAEASKLAASAASAAAAKTAAPVARTTTRVAPRPEPAKEPPKPASTTGTGRKIRTSL
jgi:serine/threonine-protein kinase